MASSIRPRSRRARAAAALGVAALLCACTAPDGGARPVLDTTLSAAGGSGAATTTAGETPTVPADASEQSVRAADGSETRVSAGSTDLLADVPVEVPLVAGDADLVQISGAVSYVVITSPGTTADVWASVTDQLAAAGFLTEDTSPDEGAPVTATAAGVFSGGGHRVTVGLALAGRTSTTVTYLVVPAS